MQQTRYELRAGEPVAIAAPADTVDFLLTAKSRSVEISGAKAEGLVVAPNRSGQLVVAASMRAKPGEYTVQVSGASASGEVRQAAMTVVVKPRITVPSTATRPPVVLLNGWETGFTNACPVAASSADDFGNLAQYLVADGVPVVFLFDNCLEDPNATIEQLGNDLGTFLNTIQYDNGTQVPQIDLVGFSMGGLIARSYLAGLQPTTEALTPPATTLVHKLVLIATPNFGSFLAGDYAPIVLAGTQSAELVPGSAFLWNLATWNQRSEDVRGVSTIAVVGNAGTYTPPLSTGNIIVNASDGVVSTTSASVGFIYNEAATSTRVVPYCHVDPATFTNLSFGTYACNAAGIANITSESHPTSQIVRSFLAGTSAWSSIGTALSADPYLSLYGGFFFGFQNVQGAYVSDISSVVWGTVQMQIGADTNTIFYDDFTNGTGVLELTSTSAGSVNCGSYAVVFGLFSAVRCKENAAIFAVSPLLSTAAGRVVAAGGNITISGADLGGACGGCKVVATPAGSTTGTNLSVSSWTGTSITAALPSSFAGLYTVTVYALTGTDSLAILAAAPATAPAIAVSPSALQFNSIVGGTAPASQTIQITNGGSGALAWTATASASWITVSPASGTAPSTLTVSVAPAGMSAGSYTGNVQIASTGASNTPLTVAVTLTIAAAPASLAVSPAALTFNFTAGGPVPAAQNVSIANGGAGTLSWTASTTDYWLAATPASGTAPGTLTVSVNPGNLAAGTYTGSVQITAAGASGSPASVAITVVVTGTQAAGNITAVANAGSFQPTAASATWLSIFGTNLSAITGSWQTSDFVNGLLPTSLDGVSVMVNGIPAYVAYVSPGQINVLAPDDATTGAVQVQVTAAQQASNSVTVQKTQFAPAFFTIDNGAYVAALHADYSLVASAGLLAGVTSTPAQPGETIQLYGTGFGPANPALPTAQLVVTPSALVNTVQVTIGGVAASLTYAGLVGPGLYQLNVTVPALANGDAAVVATVAGITSQTGVSITVHQ